MTFQKLITLDNGRFPYGKALQQQEELFYKAIEQKKQGLPVTPHLLFNEHNPVLTLGKNADPFNVLYPKEQLNAAGVELFTINRGGDVTYHGPGQWTIYPIFDLEEMGIGVRRFIYTLEEIAIRFIQRYGLKGERIEGASGVWLHTDTPFPKKICAIGVKVSRYITMHGMAFNVSVPPEDFHWINPCGFKDKGVTNLSIEAGREISMQEAQEGLAHLFEELFFSPAL